MPRQSPYHGTHCTSRQRAVGLPELVPWGVPIIDNLLKFVLYLPFESAHAEVVDDEYVMGGELVEEVGASFA